MSATLKHRKLILPKEWKERFRKMTEFGMKSCEHEESVNARFHAYLESIRPFTDEQFEEALRAFYSEIGLRKSSSVRLPEEDRLDKLCYDLDEGIGVTDPDGDELPYHITTTAGATVFPENRDSFGRKDKDPLRIRKGKSSRGPFIQLELASDNAIIRESEKAVQVVLLDGTDNWFPWSQVKEINFDENMIVVTDWIAKQKGIIK